MIIEIAEKHPAPAGKKMANVVAVGGTKFECWPEMLGNFQVGGRYEVETKSREYQGRTYQSITKATPVANGDGAVAAAAASRTSAPAQYSNGNGNKDVQIFVQGVLQALIKAGYVTNDKTQLFHTVQMLRQLWQYTLGNSANGVAGD